MEEMKEEEGESTLNKGEAEAAIAYAEELVIVTLV